MQAGEKMSLEQIRAFLEASEGYLKCMGMRLS